MSVLELCFSATHDRFLSFSATDPPAFRFSATRFWATSLLFGDISHHLSFSATRFSFWATSLLFGDVSHHLSFSATRFSAFFGDISAFRRHLSPGTNRSLRALAFQNEDLLKTYRRPPEAVFVWFTSPGRRPDVTVFYLPPQLFSLKAREPSHCAAFDLPIGRSLCIAKRWQGVCGRAQYARLRIASASLASGSCPASLGQRCHR